LDVKLCGHGVNADTLFPHPCDQLLCRNCPAILPSHSHITPSLIARHLRGMECFLDSNGSFDQPCALFAKPGSHRLRIQIVTHGPTMDQVTATVNSNRQRLDCLPYYLP